VSVKNELLSVNLKDTSLLEVARDIEKQSGVWFREMKPFSRRRFP